MDITGAQGSSNYTTNYFLAVNGNDYTKELPNPLYEQRKDIEKAIQSNDDDENLYSLASAPGINDNIEDSIPKSGDDTETEIVYSQVCEKSSRNEGHYEFDKSI